MSSREGPTFDPEDLPTTNVIAEENAREFEMLELGMSPDVIAHTRRFMEAVQAGATLMYEEVIYPHLISYGVKDEDELPEGARAELRQRKIQWANEHGYTLMDEYGEVVNE